MGIPPSNQSKRNRARQRQMARQQRTPTARQQLNDTQKREGASTKRENIAFLHNLGWYLRFQGAILRYGVLAAVALFTLYYLSHPLLGRIFPNVSTLGINIGGLSPERATDLLQKEWQSIQLQVYINGERYSTLSPVQLGLQFDALQTAEQAKRVSMGESLFGTQVLPIISLPESGLLAAQDYLLNLTPAINRAPTNAGFRWEGERLDMIEGTIGQLLDIPRTLENLSQSPANIVALRRVEVLTTSVYPQVVDSTPYLETVRNFTSTPLVFKGYDPYLDQTVTWTTDRETLTTWLEIDNEGLSVREETFAPFVEAQTNSLRAQHPEPRYIQTEEAIELLRQALANQQHEIGLRIRYEPQDYTVQAGDTASRVARKTGIPFYLLVQKNSGRNLDLLSIGDILELPSKDVTMPYAPNPNKRIVVDLDEQWLVAYESGQPVFSWSISTGIENAPTSPGIYQVLGHAEKAFGSSYNLCDDLGCGQWEMSWFMGIYEVVPGLVNGFHGAVILPDGTYLNGNRVGTPYTFGCVMSENSQAEQLYRWAEQGTVVEIISSEFAPVSQTAIQYKAQGT